ncbi:hypothetical protein ACIRVF_08115 [Kitasatospora sp. NPDC101157]|uniref:hypothetical protein n=1 Tax=Kitasatospora sp. NPDC101157 TaxID=3364098 RepID=UPI003827283D
MSEDFEFAAFKDFQPGDRIRFWTNDNGYGGLGEVWRTGTVRKVTAKTIAIDCDRNLLGDRATIRLADWSRRCPMKAVATTEDGTHFCLACGQVFESTTLLDAHQDETGHEKDAETAQQRAATAAADMRRKIAARSTEQLCYDLALTDGMPVTDPAVPMVRGWLMGELEQRDPVAFDAWVFSDENLPHRFFGIAPNQLV